MCRRSVFFVLLILSYVVALVQSIPILSPADFRDRVLTSEFLAVVFFRLPTCPHCKKFKPDWDRLVPFFFDAKLPEEKALLFDVSCADDNRDLKKLCEAQGVETIPRMKQYFPGKPEKESEFVDVPPDFNAVKKHIRKKLRELALSNTPVTSLKALKNGGQAQDKLPAKASYSGGQMWKVLSEAEPGLLVRDEVGMKSTLQSVRLKPGAVVEELELAGERLHYTKLSGEGPVEGWVSMKQSKNIARYKPEL
eukprot:gnl/TRDRNA2_/TRDRNA2_197095_c0_seq1.p1 gnl/TRDRNA2_/TRDRNA2_197095_c0~~gnl/TRDRNA2_/TRDRNA2_197095_c0_seq1.p1  ORF type:complete len:251 (+),score=40.71 gnl/TRDRNA2_/TRDRNA2_197095_c0_seq1:59-811(+)